MCGRVWRALHEGEEPQELLLMRPLEVLKLEFVFAAVSPQLSFVGCGRRRPSEPFRIAIPTIVFFPLFFSIALLCAICWRGSEAARKHCHPHQGNEKQRRFQLIAVAYRGDPRPLKRWDK
jgi:hypothetical protein